MDKVAAAVNGYRKDSPPQPEIGDTVDVKVRIKEGEKERIQTFTGVVIAMTGAGIARSFTVRRIVQGEGVERVFPFHSPFVVEVKTKKRSKVRRAKLYYLRQRKGKRARMKERLAHRPVKKPAPAPALEAKEAAAEPAAANS